MTNISYIMEIVMGLSIYNGVHIRNKLYKVRVMKASH